VYCCPTGGDATISGGADNDVRDLREEVGLRAVGFGDRIGDDDSGPD
jgi:hypothetical protein